MRRRIVRLVSGLVLGILFCVVFFGGLIAVEELMAKGLGPVMKDAGRAFNDWAVDSHWFEPAVWILLAIIVVGGIWGLGLSIYDGTFGRDE